MNTKLSRSTKKASNRESWKKKYGTISGPLLLRYRAKIAAQARWKSAERNKRP